MGEIKLYGFFYVRFRRLKCWNGSMGWWDELASRKLLEFEATAYSEYRKPNLIAYSNICCRSINQFYDRIELRILADSRLCFAFFFFFSINCRLVVKFQNLWDTTNLHPSTTVSWLLAVALKLDCKPDHGHNLILNRRWWWWAMKVGWQS